MLDDDGRRREFSRLLRPLGLFDPVRALLFFDLVGFFGLRLASAGARAARFLFLTGCAGAGGRRIVVGFGRECHGGIRKSNALGVRRAGDAEVSSAAGERVDQAGDLGLEEFRGAVVPEDEVSQLDFARQRQLRGDSQPGENARKAALLQPG